jgi:hypothetical protein
LKTTSFRPAKRKLSSAKPTAARPFVVKMPRSLGDEAGRVEHVDSVALSAHVRP